jgi:AbrB family looped-hinge helix DNA binding protein
MISTISSRGQTAVPAEIRRKFEIKPNTKLQWLAEKKGIRVIPISDPIEALAGRFKGSKLTESLIQDRNKERKGCG